MMLRMPPTMDICALIMELAFWRSFGHLRYCLKLPENDVYLTVSIYFSTLLTHEHLKPNSVNCLYLGYIIAITGFSFRHFIPRKELCFKL